METRGRKPKYNSPKDLRVAIDAYITDCEAKNVFPDYAGMKLFLKLSDRQIRNLQSEDHDDYMKYREVFEYAKDKRESWLVREMCKDNKRANGCLNALKQPNNGGYIDRPTDSGEKTLNINLVGVGGWNAFK